MPPSAIAGARRHRTRIFSFHGWLLSSLTVKIVLLAAILVALPVLLYVQFEQADKKTRSLVSGALQRQSWLIAQGLRPLLDAPDAMPTNLDFILSHYGGDGTVLKLMLAPRSGGPRGGDFYYVAAEPRGDAARLGTELSTLNRNGILRQLAPSCAAETAAEIRNGLPGARNEVLTSIIPIRSRWGCWVLVSSHTTSELFDTMIAEPYWRLPPVRLAILVYGVLALLACFLTWSALRAVIHFRRVAAQVRQGRGHARSFSSRNRIPELAPVAADFDGLVDDLHKVARDIRRKAEDNAHALKTPLATIRASLSPLRVVTTEHRGRCAIELIDASVSRLNSLITEAQRLDYFTADSIDRTDGISLNEMVMACLSEFQAVAAARGIRFRLRLEQTVEVVASADALKLVLENVLENAVSFSPDNGAIEIFLSTTDCEAQVDIADEGPGVHGADLPFIFDRYFSRRPDTAAMAEDHSGLGLWIVRENMEAMDGRVVAANRLDRGFRVSLILPRH